MGDKNEPFNADLYKKDSESKTKQAYAPQIVEDMAIR